MGAIPVKKPAPVPAGTGFQRVLRVRVNLGTPVGIPGMIPMWMGEHKGGEGCGHGCQGCGAFGHEAMGAVSVSLREVAMCCPGQTLLWPNQHTPGYVREDKGNAPSSKSKSGKLFKSFLIFPCLSIHCQGSKYSGSGERHASTYQGNHIKNVSIRETLTLNHLM